MTASVLQIKAGSSPYPVIIDEGTRKDTWNIIRNHLNGEPSSFFIITDESVGNLYLNDVLSSFPETIKVNCCTVPSGESSKSFSVYEQVMTEALEKNLDRNSMIVALGGGVIGDLAGFVAATYMRGIAFIQMPTTLLAHDSSVGGKTGINHSYGKNMIGAFHQPSLVIYDTECLKTLPEKEWRSGFAEVIKHGFIADGAFLNWISEKVDDFHSIETDVLKEMLQRSISVKADIVQLDEKEKGIRAFLNFGHTLGHAVEAESGYGKITHGEAVAKGLKFALQLSEYLFGVKIPYEPYVKKMEALGFDLTLPPGITAERLLKRMKGDKKASDGDVRFVLLKNIGEPELVKVKDEEILKVLAL
ncbi:3-dehydroquinate synthase [Evansella clarkii]|uniref:3-dehydroquinate synthase n=1 Tax=Evansella clarkii TaxID=79879 RepID=UPI000B452FFF|nr:3-dehydroquinate synthase [Evansella clarkii]